MLHEYFGDAEYWSARRSMRFADHLKDIADRFRNDKLNSNDENDSTVMPEKWENHQPKRGTGNFKLWKIQLPSHETVLWPIY